MYLCDPHKNVLCKKSTCIHNPGAQFPQCYRTSKAGFAMLDEDGQPIILTQKQDPRAEGYTPRPASGRRQLRKEVMK